ncbi:MAG TPA: PfkB family carbohydrate kinase [Humibacillus xanthopallidus]|nr:PfkB family carbohydrate kinase [Humibacillus xanthopallidus]
MTSRHGIEAVFVGVATLDAIALVPGFPGADERIVADEIAYAGGGPAATSAVAASRLGVRSAFVGTVGDDANGRAVLAGLEAEGVDVSGVSVSAGESTAASVVIVDRSRGTRAICNRPAPRIDVSAGAALIAAAPLVHVDHAGWEPVHRAGLVTDRGRLSVDAGNPVAGFEPRGVGLFVPTVEALRRVHGESLSLDELLEASIAEGCRTVVATDGARGSYALTADGESAHAPGHAVEVLSTLGAGDVFHGALVAAVVRGLPLAEQLAFANVTAALSCRGLDGRSRIPHLPEVLAAVAGGAARDNASDSAGGSASGAANGVASDAAPTSTH